MNNLPFQSTDKSGQDQPVSFEINPKGSYPMMELDTTPVTFLPKQNSNTRISQKDYQTPQSFRTRERKSQFDQIVGVKFN